MSNILALSGRHASIIQLCSGVVASSQNSLYPASNVLAGNPTKPWIAGTQISPQYLTFDANHGDNGNGGFESWDGGFPVGWTGTFVGGTIIQETAPANVHGGASAVKLTKTTLPQYVFLYRDFTVPAGTVWRIRCWVKDGTAKTGIYIHCLETGQFSPRR